MKATAMAISTAIGFAPSTSALSGIGIGGLLSGNSLLGGSSSSASTRPAAPGTALPASMIDAARAETSTLEGVAALRQSLFDALVTLGETIQAGRPNAPAPAEASRSERARAMEAKLAATIASYFQH